MTYTLGPVKPYVAQIANAVGPKFGIRLAYGYAYRDIAGTSTLSDHALGLAVDFMVQGDMSKGDALAAYMKDNAASLDVKYIIWNRRIWSVQRASEGWRTYTGVNPHTDHVHVSFDLEGSGATDAGFHLPGTGSDGKPGIPDWLQHAPGDVVSGLGNIADSFAAIAHVVEFLLDPNNWKRALLFMAGFWLLVIGITMAVKGQAAGAQTATESVAKVARTAKAAHGAVKGTMT